MTLTKDQLLARAQAVLDHAQPANYAADWVMVHRSIIGRLREAVNTHREGQASAGSGNAVSPRELREALSDVSLWLRSALDCKQWVWDTDQRLAAMGCLAVADELLKSPNEAPSPSGASAGSAVETTARELESPKEGEKQ